MSYAGSPRAVLCADGGIEAGGGDFFCGLYGRGGNFWSASFLGLPTSLLNEAIGSGDAGVGWRLLSMKNNGEKMTLDNGKFFGFKAKDMFSQLEYGFTLGWQERYSPIGLYFRASYGFDRFQAALLPGDPMTQYKLHSLKPGVGIRITPCINLLDDYGWSPMVEVEGSYTYHFKMKGPYDNDTEQINNGISSSYAIGARFADRHSRGWSIVAGFEMSHYGLFNKDFSPANGLARPYAQVKSKNYTVFVNTKIGF